MITAGPKTAPAKPTTTPGTTPSKPTRIHPLTPTKPGISPRPKALKEDDKEGNPDLERFVARRTQYKQ